MDSVEALDPFFAAAWRGELYGRAARVFNVIGRREVFVNTTAQHDVAEFLDNSTLALTDMAGNEPLEILSTSANDAAAGTGVRTVLVTYIDAAGAMVEATSVSLNGTTPVAVPFTAKAIQFMETGTAGSGGIAAGDIVLRRVSGAVPVERITTGGNKSMSGRFMVPKGWAAFVTGFDLHAVRQAMDCRLRATVFSHNRALDPDGRYRFQDIAFVPIDSGSSQRLGCARFPSGARIKLSTIPLVTTGNPRIDVTLPVLLLAQDWLIDRTF